MRPHCQSPPTSTHSAALVALLWAGFGCTAEPGTYRLHLIFPDQAALDRTDQVEILALDHGAAGCAELTAGGTSPGATEVLASLVVPMPAERAVSLRDVPPGRVRFLAEARPERAGQRLLGCAEAEVEAGAVVEVSIALEWMCAVPDDGGSSCADAGAGDASPVDTGMADTPGLDAAVADGGTPDRGADSAALDRVAADAASVDRAAADTSLPDAGFATDAAQGDASTPDLAVMDRRLNDTASADANLPDVGGDDSAGADAGPADAGDTDTWPWHIETVDQGQLSGISSLAVDSQDRVHLLYQLSTPSEFSVTYAQRDGELWSFGEFYDHAWISMIRGSIAVDLDDQPHMSYLTYDQTTYDLTYASFDGSWQVEIVPIAGHTGTHSALALTPDGHAHISFSYENMGDADLGYALWDGQVWQVQTVDSDGRVGRYSDIALASGGAVHIVYYDTTSGRIKHAFIGGSTNIGFVSPDTELANGPTVALDGSGEPHVFYASVSAGLIHARKNGGSWSYDIVDPLGGGPAVVSDPAGGFHLAYKEIANDDLLYARGDSGAWQIEVVDRDGNAGDFASIDLDQAGRPHISYREVDGNALRYAYRLIAP